MFTPNNQVINNVFSLVDNVSISLGKHELLAGVSFELQYFKNSYLRGPYGYYRYDSMDDFSREKYLPFMVLHMGIMVMMLQVLS